jgi:uncharacterized repeat protein (TIGR02543 family)
MTRNKSIRATFTQTTYTLTVNASPLNSGTFSLSKTGPYQSGEQVTITAVPASGFVFDHWSGAASGTANPITLTMNSNKTLTGYFIKGSAYTLTVSQTGEGAITPDVGTHTYNQGTVVRLTANPATGWTFAGWSGDVDAGGNTVTMTRNKSIRATFTQTTYTLTVNASPLNSGTFTLSSKGPYHNGDRVTITPNPASGYTFRAWSGDAAGTTVPLIITMDENKSITGTFVQSAYNLSVAVSPAGGGTFSLSDYGPYNKTDQVTITAKPASGYQFSRWSGDASGTTNTVIVTVDGSVRVTANFIKTGGTRDGGGGGGGRRAGTLPSRIALSGLSSPTLISVNSRSGAISADTQVTSSDGSLMLSIPSGTILLTKDNNILTSLSATALSLPTAFPAGIALLLAYELGPEGAKFDPPISATFKYGPLPADVDEKTVRLLYWNGTSWQDWGGTLNMADDMLTSRMVHFSKYALIARILTPAQFTISEPTLSKSRVNAGDMVFVQTRVANEGGMAGTLKLSFKVNEAEIDSQEIALDPSQIQYLRFQVQRSEPGEYTVAINDKTTKFVVASPPVAILSTPRAAAALSPALESADTADNPASSPYNNLYLPGTRLPLLNWFLVTMVALLGAGITVPLVIRLGRRKTGSPN